jgi:ribose 1,5-bisphosphokinase
MMARRIELLAQRDYPYVPDEVCFHLTRTLTGGEAAGVTRRAVPSAAPGGAGDLPVPSARYRRAVPADPSISVGRMTALRSGRLVYVIGASGAGKDSIIAYARDRLAPDKGYIFPQRHITRPAESGGEDHIVISLDEFERACAAGRFALHWIANGLGYGIGSEIDASLRAGRHVVINGSRAYLPEAAARYPSLLPVLIKIDPAVLRQRLLARGRETPDQIEARVRRAAEFEDIRHPALVVIVNNGALAEAGEAFIALLRSL